MTETKLALITGASRGLGAGIAEALAASHHILAVARTISGLESLDDRIKKADGQATLVPLDLCAQGAIGGLTQAIAGRWGQIDAWFHTAIHAPPLAPADQLAEKDWSKALATNAALTGNMIGAMAPFLGQNGHAVFFDDPMIGTRFAGCYGASKAAQMALVRSWQVEAARIGPNVEIWTPQPMATALRARFFPGEDREALTHPTAEAKRLLHEAGWL